VAPAFQTQEHLTNSFAHVLSVLLGKGANKFSTNAIQTHVSMAVLALYLVIIHSVVIVLQTTKDQDVSSL